MADNDIESFLSPLPSADIAGEPVEPVADEVVSRDTIPEPSPEPSPKPGPEQAAPRQGEAAGDDIEQLLAPEVDTEITVGEAVETTLKAGVGGAVRMSGVLPGMIVGAQIGGMVPPPWQVITVPLGAMIGGGAGFVAGDVAASELEEQGLAIGDPADVPPELRPFAVGGQAFGAGLTMGGQVIGVAQLPGRLPPSAVGNLINRVLDTAKLEPLKFGAIEAAATTSAAVGEGLFEVARPGHPIERAGVGIVVGMASPASLAWVGRGTYRLLMGQFQKISATGRQTAAGKELARILRASGDDPEIILDMLADSDAIIATVPGFAGTAAQRTGSKRLAELEANLAEADRVFYGERFEQGQESLRAIGNAIELLRGTGDPHAIRVAAELRRARYELILTRLTDQAERDAVEAAGNIAKGGRQADRAEISRAVTDIYERAMERSRTVESELWQNAVGAQDLLSNMSNVRRAATRLRGEMLASESFPKEIEGELALMAGALDVVRRNARGFTALATGEKITKKMLNRARELTSAEQLIKLRSRFLALARSASRSTDKLADIHSRQYGIMAQAALSDLTAAGAATNVTPFGRRGLGGRFIDADAETAYDTARAYSAALHRAFTRTFVGAARQEVAHGYAIPPETMMKRAFASGDEIGALRFRELEQASRFMPPRGTGSPELLETAEADTALMMDAQERFLRLMADRARDPVTGELRPNLLAAFMRDSEELLQRFPEVRQDLEAAANAQAKFADWSRRVQRLTRRLESDHVIARVLKTDSPADAVQGALGSAQPVTRLDEMAKLAQGSGPEAVAGFRTAFWEAMLRSSQQRGGAGLNLRAFVSNLTRPIRPGLPSPREFLETRGLMSREDLTWLDQLTTLEQRLEAAASTQATGEGVIEPAGILFNLFLRVGGSEAARRTLRFAQRFLPGGGGGAASGPTLIAAQRGAQAAVSVVERIPRLRVQGILMDAMSGKPVRPGAPEFSLLRVLLEAGGTPGEQMQRALRVHAYAWQAGFLGAADELKREERPEDEGEEDLLLLPELRSNPSQQPAEPGQSSLPPAGTVLGKTSEGRLIILNEDGSASTELTIITTVPDGEQEKFVVIPTMFNGLQVEPDEALSRIEEAGFKDPETGRKIKKFETLDEAEAHGRELSERLDKDPEVRRALEKLRDNDSADLEAAPAKAPTQEQAGNSGFSFEAVIAAQIQIESGGNVNAVSPKGALGPLQTMPDTLADPGFGVAPAQNNSPEEMLRVGREYMRAMLKRYKGNLDHALAAFNWGPDSVDRWVKRGAKKSKLPMETRKYIKKVRKELKR